MKTPFGLIPGMKTDVQCKVISILPYNYKQVVFSQSADGSWTESLLKFLKNTETFDSLLKKQSDDLRAMELAKEVLLTLVGIKILKAKFSANRSEWNLVAGKAVGYLKWSLSGQLPLPLDQLLQKIEIQTYV